MAQTMAVIGLGTIGSISASLLASDTTLPDARLVLIDHDIIEEKNLERQNLYAKDDLGKPKALVAAEKLKSLNTKVTIEALPIHIDESTVSQLNADVLLDCTDNMETRLVISDYCRKNSIPWIHSAAAGDVGVVVPVTNGACFRCIYNNKKQGLTCEEAGITRSAAQTTASEQVRYALKILHREKLSREMIRFNGGREVIQLPRNGNCKHATEKAKQLPFTFTVSRCKTRAAYSAKPNNNIKLNLDSVRKNFTVLVDTPIALVINEGDVEIVVHGYGELIFKNFYDEDKIREIATRIYEVAR